MKEKNNHLVLNRKKSSSKLNKNNKDQTKKIILFLAKFFIIYFVIGEAIVRIDMSVLTNFIASIASAPFGFPVNGNTIYIGQARFIVTNMCTGLVSASILAAVVFSLKKPILKKKIALFAFGTALLMIINILRVMLVLIAAANGMDAELVHIATWFIMSAAILAIWYYGTKMWAKVEDFSELI